METHADNEPMTGEHTNGGAGAPFVPRALWCLEVDVPDTAGPTGAEPNSKTRGLDERTDTSRNHLRRNSRCRSCVFDKQLIGGAFRADNSRDLVERVEACFRKQLFDTLRCLKHHRGKSDEGSWV